MEVPLPAYNDSIASDATNAVRAKAEGLWAAKIGLQTLIKTVERAGRAFLVAVIEFARGRLSQLGRCLGKLPVARRELVEMAASHLLSMSIDARTDFLCASSNLFRYSGTRGSLAHQLRVAERRETIYVASRPPLPPLRRVKKSQRGTLL